MRIRCSRLSLNFHSRGGTVRALEDLSLEVRDGEFLSIVGPSGCGKTTLLRAIAGLAQISRGDVELIPSSGEGEGRVLLVFQEQSLFPWMTVLENAAFGLEMQGVDRRARNARAAELLQRFGLDGREGAYPHELSAGMKQRVAVARAFVSGAHALLMDEPFAALDALTRMALQRELLEQWRQDQKTVIFVTHDIDEAILLSDRILILSGQPGTVRDEIHVRLPRPRELGMAVEGEFLEAKVRILDQLGITTRQPVPTGSSGGA